MDTSSMMIFKRDFVEETLTVTLDGEKYRAFETSEQFEEYMGLQLSSPMVNELELRTMFSDGSQVNELITKKVTFQNLK